jgi:hypothetical protein
MVRLKNFRRLIEERFSKDEVVIIEKQAEIEVKALRSLQQDIKLADEDYAETKKG